MLTHIFFLRPFSPAQKTTQDAIKFYNGKVDDLGKNLTELEKVIGGKNENIRVVEEGEFKLSHILFS